MSTSNRSCCHESYQIEIPNALKQAVVSDKPVKGLTHNFYRYPARFSPEFAREAILAFTKSKDCVIDPFVGGGTTIVESLALGRRAIGIDINSLAYFTSLVKTTPLSKQDICSIAEWAEKVMELDPRDTTANIRYQEDVFKNIPPNIAWFLLMATDMASNLRFARQRRFAKCAIIRTGQLMLDCQSSIPSLTKVKATFIQLLDNMVEGINDFVELVQSNNIPKYKISSMRQLFLGSSDSSIVDKIQDLAPIKPSLVLTSPPYPNIHVLYNKWQILGRRETTAHYSLASIKDGHGPSYYTMGSRSQRGLEYYFQNIFQVFLNLRKLITSNAIVVQLVAFPDEDSVKAQYLSMMDMAGYELLNFPNANVSETVSRTVPNRRWYTYYHEKQLSSRELLMIHRVKFDGSPNMVRNSW
ncbi:MAG: hypothetical protein JW901_07510 [Dehalococcoidia bacterium]|nr:hypothetical protein [Dehalococcoidia bacterium]